MAPVSSAQVRAFGVYSRPSTLTVTLIAPACRALILMHRLRHPSTSKVPPPAGASYDPWAGAGNNTPDVPTPQAIPAPGIAGWSVPPTPSMPTGAPSPVMMSRPVSNASKQGAWQSWGQESRSSKAGGWGSAGGAPAQTAGGWTTAFAGDGWNHYDEEEESSDEEEYPTGYVPHSHNVLGGGGHQPLSRGHQSAPTNAWMSWGKTPVDAPPQPPP